MINRRNSINHSFFCASSCQIKAKGDYCSGNGRKIWKVFSRETLLTQQGGKEKTKNELKVSYVEYVNVKIIRINPFILDKIY